MDVSCGSLVWSPQSSQAPAESSLELSPSNSSGGTYMWDEDGLEPLGMPSSDPCDSYDDADLHSLVSVFHFVLPLLTNGHEL